MPQMFVFTAGNSEARQHLVDSIQNPIDDAIVFESFPQSRHKELEGIRSEGRGFYAWGAVPGLRNTPTWETAERGDYVLCVYDSAYHYVARVLAKHENERFARRVWGEDEDGKTWKYMYFLTEPVEVYQPLYEFEGYLHSRYQGFTRISDQRLEEIEEDFGSVEDFVQEILEPEGDGQPDEPPLAPDQDGEVAMSTYLLIWNPNRWTWEEGDVRRDIAQLEESGRIEGFRWSVGTNYRRIGAGDRLFLMRLGGEPRGIFLSGFARGPAYRAAHWDPSERKRAWFVDMDVDVLLNPYDEKAILSYEELEAISAGQRWSPPASGERIEEAAATKLESEWQLLLASDRSEEMAQDSLRVDDVTHGTVDEETVPDSEGRKRIGLHTSYERSVKNRSEAIKIHGTACAVCAFDFDDAYGKDYADGYIQIHHIKPLSEYEGVVDPKTDLVPLCANCHAMAHKRRATVTSIEELKAMIEKAKS